MDLLGGPAKGEVSMAPNKRAAARAAKKQKDEVLRLLDELFKERALDMSVPEGEDIARQALEIARESLELVDEVLREQAPAESQRVPMPGGGSAAVAAHQQEHAPRMSLDGAARGDELEEPPLDDWLVCVPR